MDTDTERSTVEVFETLADDVERCYQALFTAFDQGTVDEDGSVDADYEYHARMLIRAIFAYIEGVTFSVKASAAKVCLERDIEISDAERFFSIDREFMISNTGNVVERSAHICLADNVRFAFNLQERACGMNSKFDANQSWWSDFRSSIRVRDRLTHPKMPGDLDVDGDEIIRAQRAYNGFNKQLQEYGKEDQPQLPESVG